eukprot:gene7516-7726_t
MAVNHLRLVYFVALLQWGVFGAPAAATTALLGLQIPAAVNSGATAAVATDNNQRVPVDIFVMSKCPDAVFCENFLEPVLQELQQSVTLQLHFIGQKQEGGGWSCKHGNSECNGDVQQLCVQQHSKPYNRIKWLYSFVLCNNKQGFNATGSFATAAKCLKDAHVPVSFATKMLECMYSPTRRDLLESDFALTDTLGVATSCTVRFDGSTVAVRDGGKWVSSPGAADVRDFKDALCFAYASRNR